MFQLAPCKCFKPTSPSGAGGAASSALLLGLDDVPASPAASRLAAKAAALGANVIVIMNTSTEFKCTTSDGAMRVEIPDSFQSAMEMIYYESGYILQ